ncbi:CaiB/BaiF CoA-transferase family protein [Pelomonas sp. KK5]|uniref:CaiB/BaiF CoA transferase family protein n=1 Tax=Pelomonas sp. KK5 TaxID=1855730 RepID=UPI00097C4A82|nr:CoA transferase [Pelomonas sp. KK5]
MSQALTNVRVLDLSNVLAGPFCAYQLALLGADVIKVEVPKTGDLARQLGADPDLNAGYMGASFLAQNSGKKSVTVNLKTAEGKAVLKRLVETADVLVENFRPGVMARLGLSWDELKAHNPALVYCAISGFGQDGPLKDAPAYDQIIQGLSGMMSITGDERSAPLRVGSPVADTISGITAAFAISSALVRRFRTGEGGFIDVSMLESTLVTMGWVVSNYLIAGTEPRAYGNDNMTAAPSGAFRTGSGLLNIAANKQEQFESLCREIGREDLITDARFAKRESRKRHRQELTAEIEAALSAHDAAHWEQAFNRIGIPAGRVLTVPQVLESPQIRFRQLLQTFGTVPGVDRPITVPKAGFRLSDGDPASSAPPPALGQHTDEILQSIGFGVDEISQLRIGGAI